MVPPARPSPPPCDEAVLSMMMNDDADFGWKVDLVNPALHILVYATDQHFLVTIPLPDVPDASDAVEGPSSLAIVSLLCIHDRTKRRRESTYAARACALPSPTLCVGTLLLSPSPFIKGVPQFRLIRAALVRTGSVVLDPMCGRVRFAVLLLF